MKRFKLFSVKLWSKVKRIITKLINLDASFFLIPIKIFNAFDSKSRPFQHISKLSGSEQDKRAIASDWQNVGNDMWKAVFNYDKHIRHS